jgi:hypothetical protein
MCFPCNIIEGCGRVPLNQPSSTVIQFTPRHHLKTSRNAPLPHMIVRDGYDVIVPFAFTSLEIRAAMTSSYYVSSPGIQIICLLLTFLKNIQIDITKHYTFFVLCSLIASGIIKPMNSN